MVAAFIEGNSINAIVRMTGVAKHTVLNLLRDLGCASAEYHHRNVRGLRVRRLQADEIWQFVGAKKKNVTPEQEHEGWVTFGRGSQLMPIPNCALHTGW